MNETNNLNILKTISLPKENSRQIVSAIKYFLNQLTEALNNIKHEAFQTPAGERWFKGQLKINKTINRYFNSSGQNSNLFNENYEQIEILLKTLVIELEYIINSGKGRYITG